LDKDSAIELFLFFVLLCFLNLIGFDHLIFLQRVSIACYAERCISYSKSVRPSDTRWHCVKMTPATIIGSSL